MSARNYPLPRPADDPRFTFGLTVDVARALTDRGYPAMTGRDLVELQQALFRFIYRDSLDGAPEATDSASGHLVVAEPGERETTAGEVVSGDLLWLDDQWQTVTSVAAFDNRVLIHTDGHPVGAPFNTAAMVSIRREVTP